MNRKTINGIVIVLILYVIFRLTGPLIMVLYKSMLNPNEYLEVLNSKNTLHFINNIINYGFELAIGIFLIFESKREGLHRGLWFCMGAVFGVFGLILFYIYGIYRILGKEKINNISTNIHSSSQDLAE
jgi:hypothetical protein